MADDPREWWFLQFEPGAWLEDTGVQSLSWADQGKWFRLLLAMHRSPRRGVLLHDTGAPMDDEAIAELLRVEMADWKQTRGKLTTRGVASTDEASGALVNRKMLRDTEKHEALLEARRKAGAQGAAKRWGKEAPSDGKGIADPKQAMGNNNNNNNHNKSVVTGPHHRKSRRESAETGTGETTTAPLSREDGLLNSVNFRGGLLLLLSTRMSDAAAKGLAGSYPVGRIAAVVIASQSQRSPAGWTRTALEKDYVVPELTEAERASVLEELAKSPRVELPPEAKGGRRANESSEDYFARVAGETAEKKRRADEKAKGEAEPPKASAV